VKPPSIQFHVRMRSSKFVALRPTRTSLKELIETWLETGRQPAGVRVSATLWGRPSQRRHVCKALAGRTLANLCPGIVSHFAQPDQTLCDYDAPAAPPLASVWTIAQRLGIVPIVIEDKRTRRGWHRVITWDRKFSPAETVALQLLLGSDASRETFNLERVLSGGADSSKRWNILFDRKLP
jgi:hypothetical protein